MLDFQSTNLKYSLTKSAPKDASGSPVTPHTALSLTYDLRAIATQEFKAFCQNEGFSGVRFIALPNDPKHFHFMVDNVIDVDESRCTIKREEYCSVCKNHKLVGGKTDFWNVTEPLADGFYRGNVLKGAGNAKRFPIYIGLSTQIKLDKAGLIKLNAFDLIYGPLAKVPL